MTNTFSKLITFWDFGLLLNSNNIDVITRCENFQEIAGIPIFFQACTDNMQCPTVSIIDSITNSISFDNSTCVLTLNICWGNIKNQDSTIKNILGQMISLVCWNNAVFPIHSASVTKNGHTLLFLGESGSGKTNLSYVLAKYKGYKWIGNDWVGLSLSNNSVIVKKGHDLINFSSHGCLQLHEAGFELAISENYLHTINPSSWDKTRYYTCDELGAIQGHIPSRVGTVLFIDVKQEGAFQLEKLPKNLAINSILKELVWPLRGCGSFIIDNYGYAILPSVSIQPQLGWEAACVLANRIIDCCKIYRLSGSLKSINNDFAILEQLDSEYEN